MWVRKEKGRKAEKRKGRIFTRDEKTGSNRPNNVNQNLCTLFVDPSEKNPI